MEWICGAVAKITLLDVQFYRTIIRIQSYVIEQGLKYDVKNTK